MLRTSFVVIAYNEERNLQNTLRSISAQRGLDEYEVIVVDDGSSDGTVAEARRYAATDPAVRVLALERNMGRGAARDAGVHAARGALIATVDADIVLPPDWYERCVAEIGTYDAVGGIAAPDGDVAYLHRRFGLEPRVVAHTTEVTGSNALYRREVFDAVRFDPALRNGEDVALNHAMVEAQTRMMAIDDLVARHEERKSFGESLRWLFESGVGASRQLRRYRTLRLPDVAFAGWLASVVLAIAGRRRHPAAALLPAGYTTATAFVHVQRKFVLRPNRRLAALAAVGTHATLLTAYFAGRLAGLFRD